MNTPSAPVRLTRTLAVGSLLGLIALTLSWELWLGPVWLYFTEGAVRAWSDKPPGNWLAMLEVLLCLVLFTACAMHVRLRLKSVASQSAAPSSPPATPVAP